MDPGSAQRDPAPHRSERRRGMRRTQDEELHAQDHVFLRAWIKKEQRKQELWEKVKAQVIGWGAVVLLAWLAVIFWDAVVNIIRTKH